MKDELKLKGEEKVKDAGHTLAEMGDQSAESIRQAGQDWREYIKDHPFQAMLYGVVIYYSIKGFLQEGH